MAICIAVVVIQLGVIMGTFGPPAISLIHDVTSTKIQTSTTMPTATLTGRVSL